MRGDWENAINGCWSPLFSWLLIPFLLFVKTPLYASFVARTISLIAGFFILIGVDDLSKKLGIERIFKLLILFTSIPITLSFAFGDITPDLLVTCLVIYYLIIIFDPNYSNKLSNGFFCGIIGATAYLAKSYAFAFFIVHFILFNLIYYFKENSKVRKKNVMKNFFLGISIFFVISGVWIGTISDKYGELNLGTAVEYNHDLVGPESQGHPMHYQGLLKPSNKNAVSAWEDPSYLKMEKWSPFQSEYYFKHQINVILESCVTIIKYFEYFSVFSLLIIVFSMIFITRSVFKDSRNNLIFLLVTLVIYCGGYTFVTVELRYVFLACILLIIMAFYMVNNLHNLKIVNMKLVNVLLILLMLSFVLIPAVDLFQCANIGEANYKLSQSLATDYGVHGNVASNGAWEITLNMVYYSDCKYYGKTKKTNSSNDLKCELNDNSIDYYFVWKDYGNLTPSGYKEITNCKIEGLKIYVPVEEN
ncbi:hypothetical protein DSECCO2_138960 [anaerobic digester metagenome]